ADRIGRVLGTASRPLSDPARNIRFGAYHLKEIQNLVAGLPVSKEFHPVLLIASYNAGFHNVKRWIKEIPVDDLPTFIESIPYSETRNYVKRVLQSAYLYYRLYWPAGIPSA